MSAHRNLWLIKGGADLFDAPPIHFSGHSSSNGSCFRLSQSPDLFRDTVLRTSKCSIDHAWHRLALLDHGKTAKALHLDVDLTQLVDASSGPVQIQQEDGDRFDTAAESIQR